MIDLENGTGVAIKADPVEHQLILPEDFVPTTYRTRRLHDLSAVWNRPLTAPDQVAYWYSAGLTRTEDEKRWAEANIIYGIVFFHPGSFDGEFVKSSGQFHPPHGPTQTATPEIYTVLHGVGYFLLQKARAPYTDVTDPILVEVRAGESFIVPPDYGHLQINPTNEPLIFSYVVMDGMQGVYEPYRETQGAMHYILDDAAQPSLVNERYANPVDLRTIRASELDQHPLLKQPITYQNILNNLDELSFITQPEQYPAGAHL